jgi:perosamine synthetase
VAIPLSVPEIAGNEWRYVRECLESGWVSSAGSFVERFEREMATYLGTEHAVATVNGTAALHVALKVAGVEPDDEVLVSTLTFIAPVNAVRYCGAHPVFMDSEKASWNIDPAKVVEFLKRECRVKRGRLINRMTGRRIAAILPVHILGHPADLDPILEVARHFAVPVVEDAAESLGALYKGRPIGTFGDIACLSFNGNKIITSGGGGMIITRHAAWARRARHLTTQAKREEIEYRHDEVGYNYRLVNVLAALGLAQLEMLPQFLQRKRDIALRYHDALKGIDGITLMPEAPWARPTFWLYTVLLDRRWFQATRAQVISALGRAGIQARPIWFPIHRQLMYRRNQAYRIEVADDLHRRGVSLPCSVGLSQQAQDRVVRELRRLAERTA